MAIRSEDVVSGEVEVLQADLGDVAEFGISFSEDDLMVEVGFQTLLKIESDL